MQIKVKLNFKEYLKLQYVLTYQNYLTLISTFIVFIALVMNLLQMLDGDTNDDTVFWVVFLSAYIFFRPISIYFAAKKNFTSHQTLQEEITYGFHPDKVTIATPFSAAELPWNKMHKIRELKEWFLIYQSNRLAHLIPKSHLSQEDILNLRELLKNSGIKTQLKPK
jgi:amino acid permease